MNTCTGRDSASSGSEFDPTDPQREIKQIFQCFDADGDGFIDRTDLVEVCRHLGLGEDYADDIMAQIGVGGLISFAQFSQSNLGMMSNGLVNNELTEVDNISDRADIWDNGSPPLPWDYTPTIDKQDIFEKTSLAKQSSDSLRAGVAYSGQCEQCNIHRKDLTTAQTELINAERKRQSVQMKVGQCEAEIERLEGQCEQAYNEVRSSKQALIEASQLKDIYRRKCEAYMRQRKDIEEQLTSGSLEGVTRVMKAPLTLDEMYNNNEETRDELLWKVQSYEEQMLALREEVKALRERRPQPTAEPVSLEEQLSDKVVIAAEVEHAADAGVMDTSTASSLSEALQGCQSVRDIIKTLFSHGTAQVDKQMKERELQLERQNTKVEHLKSQIDVMALTLAESKGGADKLSLLVGQYDAANSALTLALKYTEMAVEVSEVLTALSDTDHSLLVANCKADNTRKKAVIARRQIEMRAKSLLQRLEKTLEDPSGVWETMSNSTHTSKLSNGASSNASVSSTVELEITQTEVLRFKEYKELLKGHKNALKASLVQDLDPSSVLASDDESPRTNCKTDLRADLEHAVMLQELNCAKEERAEMKAMAYLAQQERRTLELRLEASKLQEKGYKTQMSYFRGEWREEQRKRRRLAKEVKSRETGEGNPEQFKTEHELAEAVKREKKLKVKVNELAEALDRLARNAESRHSHQSSYVTDLKRANEALTGAYDKSKKKHSLSLKKLEAQISTLVNQYEVPVPSSRESAYTANDPGLTNRLSYFDEQSVSSTGSGHHHGEETEL